MENGNGREEEAGSGTFAKFEMWEPRTAARFPSESHQIRYPRPKIISRCEFPR